MLPRTAIEGKAPVRLHMRVTLNTRSAVHLCVLNASFKTLTSIFSTFFFFFSYRLCLLIPDLVYDPQMSVPDVIVWILTSGTRRAFIRIPAVDLIYHPQVRAKHP